MSVSLVLWCVALACLPVVANASILGISLLPTSSMGSSSSLISIGGSSTVSVELPTLAKVEVTVPAVELPSVAKVEVPSVAKVEGATTTITTSPTPSAPTSSTPTPLPTSPQPPTGGSSHPVAVGTHTSTAVAATTTTAASTEAISPSRAASVDSPAQVANAVGAGARTRAGKQASTRNRHVRGFSSDPTAVGPSTASAVPSAAHVASRPHTATRTIAAHSSNPLDSLGKHIPLPLPVPNWSKPIILLLLLLAIWFAVRSRLAAVRARRLEGQRALLLQDLGVMQATLVPVIPERLGTLNVSVAYRPADGPAAGGDFYDVFELDQGKVALILGDVAGHGQNALKQAALTRYTLRAYMQAGMAPRAALALAGNVLADPAATHFATVVVGVYDSANATLTYASAGHPAPISTGFDAPEPLVVCCSAPVGWDVATGRRQSTVSLPAGAAVCFFSDGLIEARTDDGLLGRERLSELLAELGPHPAASDLLERVKTTTRATPDDMVSCIIAPELGVAGADTHFEELEVDAMALAGERVRLFLASCGVDAAERDAAIARALAIAGEAGTALLRIDCLQAPAVGAVTVQAGLEVIADAPPGEGCTAGLPWPASVAPADDARARGLQPAH
jgi:hypothetical protein